MQFSLILSNFNVDFFYKVLNNLHYINYIIKGYYDNRQFPNNCILVITFTISVDKIEDNRQNLKYCKFAINEKGD